MEKTYKEIIIKFSFDDESNIYVRYHNCSLERAKECARRYAKILEQRQQKECTLIELCHPYRFGVLRATIPYPCREN